MPKIMDINIKIAFTSLYYKLNNRVCFYSKNEYHRFINWISGEFDLYLQKVFYVFFLKKETLHFTEHK